MSTLTGRPVRAPRSGDVIGGSPFSALVEKAVKDRAQVVGAASFYMVAIGAVLGLLWAPLRDVFRSMPQGMNDFVAAISGGTDLSTPAGWANAELLSLLAPAAAIVVGVLSAAGLSADEESKTLGLALSAPVSRTALLVSRMLATAILVAIVAACVALGITVGNAIGGLGFTVAGILGAATHTFFLGLVFAGLALVVAGATGNRRLSTVVPALVAVLAFAAQTFLPLNPALAGGQRLSPWYYYLESIPLQHGADLGDLVILGVVAVVLGVVAVVTFRRRDLRR